MPEVEEDDMEGVKGAESEVGNEKGNEKEGMEKEKDVLLENDQSENEGDGSGNAGAATGNAGAVIGNDDAELENESEIWLMATGRYYPLFDLHILNFEDRHYSQRFMTRNPTQYTLMSLKPQQRFTLTS